MVLKGLRLHLMLLVFNVSNEVKQIRNSKMSTTTTTAAAAKRLTCRMRAALKVFVENLQCLRSERSPPLPFLRRHKTDEVAQVLCAVLVPLLGHRHPAFQNGLYLLCALRRYVQLLKPASFVAVSVGHMLRKSGKIVRRKTRFWKPHQGNEDVDHPRQQWSPLNHFHTAQA